MASSKTRKSARASAPRKFAIAILAAGKGTRLRSKDPKVLHRIGGKPLLEHVIRAALKIAKPTDVYAIVGHEESRVRAAVEHTGVRFISQPEQRGTGHALMCASEALRSYADLLVLSGDVPLIQPNTMQAL